MNKITTKKHLKFLIILALFVIAVLIYAYLNMKYHIGFPCLLNTAFGIYCPGCGLTRATVALLQLDFYQAFRYNMFSIILVPVLFLVMISCIWEYVFDRPSLLNKVPVGVWCILFGIISVYGIVRNFIPELQPI